MARKAKRLAVERGLYRAGDVWWACATPKGQRTARWLRLGDIGIQEAQRMRDEFAFKLNAGQAPSRARRLTVREVQAGLVRSSRRARGIRRAAPTYRRLLQGRRPPALHTHVRQPPAGIHHARRSRRLARAPAPFRRCDLVGSRPLDGDPRTVRIRRANGTHCDQSLRSAGAARAPEAGKGQAALSDRRGDDRPAPARVWRRLDRRPAAPVLQACGHQRRSAWSGARSTSPNRSSGSATR
jgi:hypothetical protein